MINASDLIEYSEAVVHGLSFTAEQVKDFSDHIHRTTSTDQPSEVQDQRELLVLEAMIVQLKKKKDLLMDRNRSEEEKKRHALVVDMKRHTLAMLPSFKELPALSSEEEKRRFAAERVYEHFAKRRIEEPRQFKTGDTVEERFKDDIHRKTHSFLVETHTIGDTKMVSLKHDTEMVLTMTMNHAMLCFKGIEKRPASPVVPISEDETTPLLELDDDEDEGLSSAPVTQAALDDELPPKKRQRRDDEEMTK